MKRIIILLTAIAISLCSFAQERQLEELIDNYKRSEGFTSAKITRSMITLAVSLDSEASLEDFKKIKNIYLISHKESTPDFAAAVAEVLEPLKLLSAETKEDGTNVKTYLDEGGHYFAFEIFMGSVVALLVVEGKGLTAEDVEWFAEEIS